MKNDSRRRMKAYAKALHIQSAVRAIENRISHRTEDDPTNAVSTTGALRDKMETLHDGEMLVIPIGGDADEFQ